MHNATTKQRHAALRRKLGIFLGHAPRWVREKKARLARLTDSLVERALSSTATPTPAFVRTDDVFQATATERIDVGFAPVPPEPRRDTPPPVPYAETVRVSRREHDGPPTTRWVVMGAIVAVLAVLGFSILREARQASSASTSTTASTSTSTSTTATTPAAAPAATAATATTVARGDTLWHLAARHLGDPARWPALHGANRELIRDPDLIYPGQELKIPSR